MIRDLHWAIFPGGSRKTRTTLCDSRSKMHPHHLLSNGFNITMTTVLILMFPFLFKTPAFGCNQCRNQRVDPFFFFAKLNRRLLLFKKLERDEKSQKGFHLREAFPTLNQVHCRSHVFHFYIHQNCNCGTQAHKHETVLLCSFSFSEYPIMV